MLPTLAQTGRDGSSRDDAKRARRYRVSDYLKVGTLVTLIVIVGLTLMIPILY